MSTTKARISVCSLMCRSPNTLVSTWPTSVLQEVLTVSYEWMHEVHRAMSPASSHVVSLIPLQTQRWDPRRVWREGERQACGKGCSLTPLPPLPERRSLTPPSPIAPLATVWPLLCTLRVLSTSPSRYPSLLQPTTCMTGFSVSLPRSVWALHEQALRLSCLPLYPLTPGPGLWKLHKYLLTNSLSWSGQRWDLNPGMSDSQGSLGTQGPDHGEGLKD